MKRGYIGCSFYSFKSLKNNLILYLPDLAFFAFAFILTFLFFHFNGLTSIFGGQLNLFNSKIKEITTSNSLLIRLISSFAVLIIINVFFGLSIITLRYTMIKSILKNEKIKFFKVWKNSKIYVFPVLWLKLCIFLIYLVPALVLIGIGLLYKPLILIMILMEIFVVILTRFYLLFAYSTLFLKDIKNPFTVIKETVNYFNNNKVHGLIVGLIVFFISLIISGFVSLIPVIWDGINLFGTMILVSVLYIIFRTLVDITVNLLSLLFIFENY